MTLYDLFSTYIMPHLVDTTLFGGVAENVFYQIFVWTISIVVIHSMIVLPYMCLMKLVHYRPTWWWRKK